MGDAARTLARACGGFLTASRRESAKQVRLRVFVCYASEDERVASKWARQLQDRGYDVWFDREALLPGDEWEATIRRAVRETDAVVVAVSRRATTKTGFVQKELRLVLDAADERPPGRTFILPVRLDDSPVPERLAKYHHVSVSQRDWFERIDTALRAEAKALGRSVGPRAPGTFGAMSSAARAARRRVTFDAARSTLDGWSRTTVQFGEALKRHLWNVVLWLAALDRAAYAATFLVIVGVLYSNSHPFGVIWASALLSLLAIVGVVFLAIRVRDFEQLRRTAAAGTGGCLLLMLLMSWGFELPAFVGEWIGFRLIAQVAVIGFVTYAALSPPTRPADVDFGLILATLVVIEVLVITGATVEVVVLLSALVALWIARGMSRITGGTFTLAMLAALTFLLIAQRDLIDRFGALLEPSRGRLDDAFQTFTSMAGVSSGAVLGRGPGESLLALDYLPGWTGPFRLAVFTEEWGLVGFAAVLAAGYVVVRSGLRFAARTSDPLAGSLAVVGAALLMTPAAMNALMTVGLWPSTTIDYPMIGEWRLYVLPSALAASLILIARRNDRHLGRNVPRAGVPLVGAPALQALFLGVLIIAGAKATFLAIFQHESYGAAITSQAIKTVTIPGLRGTLIDRSGRKLVASEPAADITATPYIARANADVSASKLSEILGVPASGIRPQLDSDRGFEWIKRLASASQARAVQRAKLTGVDVSWTYRRSYPQGRLLGPQVLGITGVDGMGLFGIEQSYERALRGRAGKFDTVRSADAYLIKRKELVPAVNGTSMVLTLDSVVQRRLQAALESATSGAGSEVTAAGVVLGRRGEILGQASEPSFNLDALRQGTVSADKTVDRAAIQMLVEPRSLIEPFVRSAALEESGLRDPSVSTAKLASRVGARSLDEWLRNFGFGTRSGVDLRGEPAGVLPALASDFSEKQFQSLIDGLGMRLTPLQLAGAYGVLLDNGLRYRPHLLIATRKSGTGKYQRTGKYQGRQVLSPGVARAAVPPTSANRSVVFTRTVVDRNGTAVSASLNQSTKTPYVMVVAISGIAKRAAGSARVKEATEALNEALAVLYGVR